jgi:hypothetical protein
VSLETSRYQLHTALKTAVLHWEETCRQWDDPVRREFEADYWNHLEPAVKQALAELDKLSEVIARLRRECEGGGE